VDEWTLGDPALKMLTATAACVVSLTVSMVGQSPRRDVPAVLFDGARLITGDGSAAIERSAFIVQGDTFVRVGRQGELKTPTGFRRVDLSGKTVMPALVDIHTHLGYRRGATFRAENFTRDTIVDELNRFAYFGVAAVGSAGTDRGDLTLRLRDDLRARCARTPHGASGRIPRRCGCSRSEGLTASSATKPARSWTRPTR